MGCKYQIIIIVPRMDLLIHKEALNGDGCPGVSQETTGARSAHEKSNIHMSKSSHWNKRGKSLSQCYLLLWMSAGSEP